MLNKKTTVYMVEAAKYLTIICLLGAGVLIVCILKRILTNNTDSVTRNVISIFRITLWCINLYLLPHYWWGMVELSLRSGHEKYNVYLYHSMFSIMIGALLYKNNYNKSVNIFLLVAMLYCIGGLKYLNLNGYITSLLCGYLNVLWYDEMLYIKNEYKNNYIRYDKRVISLVKILAFCVNFFVCMLVFNIIEKYTVRGSSLFYGSIVIHQNIFLIAIGWLLYRVNVERASTVVLLVVLGYNMGNTIGLKPYFAVICLLCGFLNAMWYKEKLYKVNS